MGRRVLLAVLALGLGGCAVTAVVGAAATVVGAGAKVAGSAVSATIDIVGAGVSGAIDLATGDDDEDRGDGAPVAAPRETGAGEKGSDQPADREWSNTEPVAAD